MAKKTVVINLLGGPGVGKSTAAALIYGEMRRRKWNAELVREFVKEWAWEGRKPSTIGQSIIFGRQLERESLLYGKVDFIVTDSPLLLCAVYNDHYFGNKIMAPFILKNLQDIKNMGVEQVNFLMTREAQFSSEGRFEDEETAKKIDDRIGNFLEYHKIEHVKVGGPQEGRIRYIMDYIDLTFRS